MHRTFIKVTLLLSLFSLNAAAAITAGPERALSGITYAPPAGEQRPGAVASDNGDFLSVWTDVTSPRQGVYAARVTSSGQVSVASQRLIRAGAQRDVSVCWAGDGYLATWSDDASQSVFSAKLARDGSVIAGPRIIVAAQIEADFTITAGTYPRALACSNNGALLVFKRSNQPRAAILDSVGNITKETAALPFGDNEPMVTISDGSSYYVFVRSRAVGAVVVTRISSAGSIVDATPLPVFPSFNALQLGAAFRNGRIAVAAVSIDTLKRAFIDVSSFAISRLPDIASGGQEVTVVGNLNNFDAYVMRYDLTKLDIFHVPLRDNEATAPQPALVLHSDSLGHTIGVASNGQQNLAVWKDFRHSVTNQVIDGDIYGALLDAGGGSSSAPFPIAISARWQGPVSAASSGTESMIVWNERIGDANQTSLMAMRVAPNGTLLDAQPRQLAASVVQTAAPSIVWDGSGYVVAWTEVVQTSATNTTSVVAQRYGRDGNPSAQEFRFEGPFSPSLGTNGSVALLAFTYPDGRGLNFVILQSSTTFTPTPTPLNVYGYSTSIGSIGGEFLIAWTEGAETCQIICFPDRRDIAALRISGSGTIIGAEPIPIANGLKDQAYPHIASNGSDYLIVYNYWVDGIWTLAAKRLSRTGQLIDFVAGQDGIILGNDVAPSAAIARDESTYVVAYDLGNGSDGTVLRALRLNDVGTVVEQSGSLGFGTRAVPSFPSLAKVPGGPLDIAYSRYANDQTYGATMRAFVRLMPDASAPPPPGRQRAVRH